MEIQLNLLVLMLNDSPIGIYSTQELADSAVEVYAAAHPVVEGQSQYYYTREHTVDAPASL